MATDPLTPYSDSRRWSSSSWPCQTHRCVCQGIIFSFSTFPFALPIVSWMLTDNQAMTPCLAWIPMSAVSSADTNSKTCPVSIARNSQTLPIVHCASIAIDEALPSWCDGDYFSYHVNDVCDSLVPSDGHCDDSAGLGLDEDHLLVAGEARNVLQSVCRLDLVVVDCTIICEVDIPGT